MIVLVQYSFFFSGYSLLPALWLHAVGSKARLPSMSRLSSHWSTLQVLTSGGIRVQAVEHWLTESGLLMRFGTVSSLISQSSLSFAGFVFLHEDHLPVACELRDDSAARLVSIRWLRSHDPLRKIGPMWAHMGSYGRNPVSGFIGPIWAHWAHMGLRWNRVWNCSQPFWNYGPIYGPIWVHIWALWAHMGPKKIP